MSSKKKILRERYWLFKTKYKYQKVDTDSFKVFLSTFEYYCPGLCADIEHKTYVHRLEGLSKTTPLLSPWETKLSILCV